MRDYWLPLALYAPALVTLIVDGDQPVAAMNDTDAAGMMVFVTFPVAGVALLACGVGAIAILLRMERLRKRPSGSDLQGTGP